MNWNKRETAWKKKLKKWTEKKNKTGVNEDRKLFYSDTQFLAIIRILFCLRLVLLNHTICVFIPEWEQITLIILKITPYQFDLVFLYKQYEWLTHWLCDNVLPLALVYWKLDVLFIKVWNSANFIETGLQNHQYFPLRISLSFRRRYAIETHRSEKFSGSPLVAVEQIELQLN